MVNYTQLFFAALKTERVKMNVCAEYNKKNPDSNLSYSTLCRWINTSDPKLTMYPVVEAIKTVTGLTDKQIHEPKKK